VGIIGRFLRTIEAFADEDSKGRTAANDDRCKACQSQNIAIWAELLKKILTHRAFEYCPQKHPLWFWCRGLAAAICAQLNDPQRRECNAEKTTPKEDKDTRFLRFRHLQVPRQADWQKHDYVTSAQEVLGDRWVQVNILAMSVATSTAYAKYKLKMILWSSLRVPPHLPFWNFSLKLSHVKMLLKTLPIQAYDVIS
jgi:hypothetical protein